MFVPAAHQRVVGFVLVRVDHAAALNFLHSNAEKRFGPYIWEYFDVSPAAASQDSEDGNLAQSPSAGEVSVPLPSSPRRTSKPPVASFFSKFCEKSAFEADS